MRAGVVYALVVFAIGFLFGTIRMLIVAPRLGSALAVLLESPFMLVASWWVCRRCITRFKVSAIPTHRLLMGLAALGTLTLAEVALAAAAFGQSPIGYILSLESTAGAVGLAAQLAFASFPLLQTWWAESAKPNG